ncbi:molybdopterin molybdotransferase MoeA [Acetobacter conturbans]|uniref:molybdopterin molybdotransferase MoeA n=1 Tax=Acetobacter conturbans TaxID=1737472 RepID=UPI0030CC2ECE
MSDRSNPADLLLEMVDYDTAQALLSAALRELPSVEAEHIPLALSCGRILAEDVRAVACRPETDISAMDGYAFRCADMDLSGQKGLPLSGCVAAGDSPEPLRDGTACVILTGARIPAGADCVVARERVVVAHDRVHLTNQTPVTGLNIRRKGEEFLSGTPLLPRGQALDWRHMALLASQGMTHVAVSRPIRVAVLANGAEFDCHAADARTELNTLMLSAMLQSESIRVRSRVAATDSPDELGEALRECIEHSDVVVTTGGISVGQTDHVLPVLTRMGATCLFRRVRMRPGKPVTVMRLGRKIIFCLPGNPGAAALCAQLFVMPFLRAFTGLPPHRENRLAGRSAFAFTPTTDATSFLPVAHTEEEGEIRFSLIPSVGASDVRCLTRATALLRVDAGESVDIGSYCRAVPFTDL